MHPRFLKMRKNVLPYADPVFRGKIHAVAFLDSEGFLEFRELHTGDVNAEIIQRVRILRDQHLLDFRRIGGLPDIRE